MPAGRQPAAVRASVGKRELELRRRRSRVPWIYAVYHARERRLDGWTMEGMTGTFERITLLDPFEPPEPG
jgi:hypothetical protein